MYTNHNIYFTYCSQIVDDLDKQLRQENCFNEKVSFLTYHINAVIDCLHINFDTLVICFNDLCIYLRYLKPAS